MGRVGGVSQLADTITRRLQTREKRNTFSREREGSGATPASRCWHSPAQRLSRTRARANLPECLRSCRALGLSGDQTPSAERAGAAQTCAPQRGESEEVDRMSRDSGRGALRKQDDAIAAAGDMRVHSPYIALADKLSYDAAFESRLESLADRQPGFNLTIPIDGLWDGIEIHTPPAKPLLIHPHPKTEDHSPSQRKQVRRRKTKYGLQQPRPPISHHKERHPRLYIVDVPT